jgi:hypothetical protein
MWIHKYTPRLPHGDRPLDYGSVAKKPSEAQ